MPLKSSRLFAFLGLLGLVAPVVAQGQTQIPVASPLIKGNDVTVRAEQLLDAGKGIEATELLGRYLTDSPHDGRAWFFLGRIYLASLRQWHNGGHLRDSSAAQVDAPSAALLNDLAAVAFDESTQLLADSGGVFRTLVTIERATTRVEEDGWPAAMSRRPDPSDLPLPPIVVELGNNLIASCPAGGVMVTGSDIELAGVWGVQMMGVGRSDLLLLRPDRYSRDAAYRFQMSKALGTDSSADLRTALSKVKAKRPICLTPSLDTLVAPSLGWRAEDLVMVAGARLTAISPRLMSLLSVHQLSRAGLAGSVWSAPVRDLYDAAARLNKDLCTGLFTVPDPNFPTITACRK